MSRNALVISERVGFRSVAKRAVQEAFPETEVRYAADARIGIAKLSEDAFSAVVVDDDTVRGFFDDVFATSAFVIRCRSGGRSNTRLRQSPFSYLEVIVPDTCDSEALHKALKQSFGEAQRHLAVPDSRVANGLEHSTILPKEPSVRKATVAVNSGTTLANRTNPEIIIPEIIAIGSSTGGPEALERFFVAMDSWFVVPVVVVQHMPAGFSRGLAERLSRVTGFLFHEAQHEQQLISGQVYIAPGDFHLRLRKGGDKIICSLDKGPLINSVRPAVDPMFETATTIFGPKVMSIVLTGMGEDGAVGAQAVKNAGGCVAIQNEESCVVWGMPGSVARLHLHDFQGTPEEIASVVSRQNMRKGAPPKKMVKTA